MMEERGFVRKQARVDGVSQKAWIGIRLKTYDELMADLKKAEVANTGSTGGSEKVKRFPGRPQYMSVFNGGVKVG
jgi:hypothetical protein